jgi:hypothetical protein
MISSFLKCAEDLQDKFNEKKISRGKLEATGVVISFLFGKNYKTAKATLLLCKNGYSEDALILARANFEAMLWALYILRDKETSQKKAKAFIKSDAFDKKKAMKQMLNLDEDNSEFKADLQMELNRAQKELDELINEDKEVYELAESISCKKANTFGLAEETNMLLLYRSFYSFSSLYAHSKVRSSIPFISESEHGIKFSTVPTEKGLRNALINVCHFLWYLMDGYNTLFDLGLKQVLDNKWTELNTVIGKTTPAD